MNDDRRRDVDGTGPPEPSGPEVVDDPTGGRRLTRRLAVGLPIAALSGVAIGIPLALLASDWRILFWSVAGLTGLVAVILGALEDGRVQRRVDAASGRSGANQD